MGKGQIVANLGVGQYSVKLLSDRTQADKALVRINAWIAKADEALANLPAGDPEHKGPGLRLNKASLLKQKEYLESIPGDQTVSVWCADYTLDLSGDVGTIEINGDPEAGVNIRAGYLSHAAYSTARDGQIQNIRAMTSEQAFYNMAMMPGWQKWMPTYRVGTITSITGDTCTVKLDAADSALSSAGTGPLNINQAIDIEDVDIDYMNCHGKAFSEGDRVIVQFINQDFSAPQVIGFRDNPKPCSEDICYYIVHGSSPNYMLTAYQADGTFWKDIDLNTILNVPIDKDRRIKIFFGSGDLNFIVCEAFVTNWRGYVDPVGSTPLFTNRWPVKIPIDIYGLDKMSTDLLGYSVSSYIPDAITCGKSAFIASRAAQIFSNSDFEIYTKPITQGTYYQGHVYEGTYDNGQLIPTDANHWRTIIWAIGTFGDYLIMAVTREYYEVINYDPVPTDSFIGIFPYPENGNYQWQDEGGIGGFLGSVLHKVDFAWEIHPNYHLSKLYYTYQILVHDWLIFVIWSDYNTDYLEVQTFDFELNTIIPRKVVYIGEPVGQFSIITYSNKKCLCFFTGTVVKFLDIESDLNEVGSVTIPGLVYPAFFLALSLPKTNYMLQAINDYRFTQPGISISFPAQDPYVMPIGYLGYSSDLESCARLHANWCVANCRVSHEDANGELVHERAEVYGFMLTATGENIAFIEMMASQNDETDECLRLWKESPGHNYNLISSTLSVMGWAAAAFPETCHSITIGPGQYNPVTHEYTAEDTVIDLAPSQYGRMKIYVYNVA